MKRLRILTWHVHGNYLLYLTQARHNFFLPVRPSGGEGYGGRGRTFPFGPNVQDVVSERVPHERFDVVLFQSRRNYVEDQFELLSPEQRRLPRIYLEHDPPREHPTDTRHVVDDPDVLLVHVTPFNELMWTSGQTSTRVIEHGVLVPEDVRCTGELARGISVVNNLPSRGRRVGSDVYERVRRDVPLDLVGMDSERAGGLGEVPPTELPRLVARYRFFFNPIRYTSLGLAVCEAMMLGVPVIGLATTEMATAVENGVSGYVDTRVSRLVERMRELLADRSEARRLGEGARERARQRFGIERFVRDWDDAFRLVVGGAEPKKRPLLRGETAP
ncbi:MAG: glycosyltransferase family 4 protein [Actinomycetota bacterium]|nr:glycosyltransferase family 4 protein [Actinomycetota bacterium]